MSSEKTDEWWEDKGENFMRPDSSIICMGISELDLLEKNGHYFLDYEEYLRNFK